MLPGFRFLFSAIVLSLSILVFGLGAAALLRAAHEEFASNPTWRAPAETVFAQQNLAAKSMLATLVIEPAGDPKLSTAEAPAGIDAVPSPEPDRVATLTPAQSAPYEMAKPETVEREIAATDKPMMDIPAQPEPPPVQADLSAAATLPAGETQTAVVEQTSPVAELSLAASKSVPADLNEQTTSLAAPVAEIEKIAALNGRSEIEKAAPPKPSAAAPDQSAIKKRLMEERAREKHRAAVRRARLAQQAARQLLLFQQQPQLQQQQLQQQQLLQQQQQQLLQQQQFQQQQIQQQTRLQQQAASPATNATRSR